MVKALNICSKKFGSVVNSMSPSRRVLCLVHNLHEVLEGLGLDSPDDFERFVSIDI